MDELAEPRSYAFTVPLLLRDENLEARRAVFKENLPRHRQQPKPMNK